MDAAIYSLTLAAIAFLAFLSLKPLDRRLTYALGLLFALYIGLDDFVTGLPPEFPELRPFDTRWNWWGKIYSVLFSIVVIAGLRLRLNAVGLAWPGRNLRTGAIAVAVMVSVSVPMGLMLDPDPPTMSTLAFQGLMPGLAEELAYRGIAPALLLGLMQRGEPPTSVPWIVICVAAIPFGVVHGLGYSDGGYSFAIGPALYTLTGGVIYGWMRFHTGSLLFPFLAHGLANAVFHLLANF